MGDFALLSFMIFAPALGALLLLWVRKVTASNATSVEEESGRQ